MSTLGLALLDMAQQIENNRVDTEDRKERLRSGVAAPLLALVADEAIDAMLWCSAYQTRS